MAYTAKEKDRILKRIYKKYATGKYPIVALCNSEGITYRTFRKWDKDYQERLKNQKAKGRKNDTKKDNNYTDTSINSITSYEKALEKSHEMRRKALKERALTALEYHLEVREIEEKKQIGKVGRDGKVKTERVEVVKKEKAPNPMLVRFALMNADPEHFRERVEHNGELRTLVDLIEENRKRAKSGQEA